MGELFRIKHDVPNHDLTTVKCVPKHEFSRFLEPNIEYNVFLNSL